MAAAGLGRSRIYFLEAMKMNETVTIGSDPEFIFVDDIHNRQIPARIILPNSLRTTIGVDGSSSTAELRPPYEEDAIKHYENITYLLRKTQLCYNKENYRIEAGLSQYDAIGGHIHFGGADSPLIPKILDIACIFMLNFYDANLKRLHTKRINKDGYGMLGAVREKYYGVEYRTPISWLGNPIMAKSFLAVAHTLAYEAVNHPEHVEKMIRTFQNRFKKSSDVVAAYANATASFFSTNNEYFIKNVRKCRLYQTKKHYRATFESLISLLRCGKTFTYTDVAKNWKLNEKIPFMIFSARDEKMTEIKSMVCRIKDVLISDMQLYVYGLRDSRNVDIITNNKSVHRYVKFLLTINGQKGFSMKYDSNLLSVNSIGFSLRMRQKEGAIIGMILKKINDKCQTLKLRKEKRNYIENPTAEIAQTDVKEEDDIDPEEDDDTTQDGE